MFLLELRPGHYIDLFLSRHYIDPYFSLLWKILEQLVDCPLIPLFSQVIPLRYIGLVFIFQLQQEIENGICVQR